jgi:hypothetical protein
MKKIVSLILVVCVTLGVSVGVFARDLKKAEEYLNKAKIAQSQSEHYASRAKSALREATEFKKKADEYRVIGTAGYIAGIGHNGAYAVSGYYLTMSNYYYSRAEGATQAAQTLTKTANNFLDDYNKYMRLFRENL